jgi:hypothetical protein
MTIPTTKSENCECWWNFTAVDDSGRPRRGALRVPTRERALSILRERLLFPKQLQQADSPDPNYPELALPLRGVQALRQLLIQQGKNPDRQALISFPTPVSTTEGTRTLRMILFADRMEFQTTTKPSLPVYCFPHSEIQRSEWSGELTLFWVIESTTGARLQLPAGTHYPRREFREAFELMQEWFRT